MDNNLIVKEVEFDGAILMAVQDEETEQIYVGVKWVCEGLGLTQDQMKNERKKIQSDLALSQGGRKLTLPTKGGKQEVLTLELDFLPLWLAKISITPTMQRDNPELVDRLVTYQLKAKDVLANAFLKKNQLLGFDVLSPQVQALVNMEFKQKELENKIVDVDNKVIQFGNKVDNIKEIVALNSDDWRKSASELINKTALALGGHENIRLVRNEIYALIDSRYKVSLNQRLNNKQKNLALNGASQSKIKGVTKVDVIADDKKLIEAYINITKETAIKYGVYEMVQ